MSGAPGDIVVSTVQSLLFNNKYQKLFSPTDFDLVISDEAHRSIGGNARAVFDYFVGYKLGLTATPRDYLKRFDRETSTGRDPREYERRLLLDTYRTFGCEQSEPTFRYTLLDGVKDGFLINPTVVDARTGITTQLLSEEGFTVDPALTPNAEEEASYGETDFERKFFAEATNMLFCKTFLENALRDPISGEIGKSIVFAVSQNHAAKLAQILNQMADRMFPGRYHSDFAVQVTSLVDGAQQMTLNFANNNLLGSGNFLPAYKTSKARVCVTVGMMTTGYDCPDILNLALMRPIFSPTDFIQMKGRGTRGHNFTDEVRDDTLRSQYQDALRSNQATDELSLNYGLIVPKEKIAENGDYNLSGERYRARTHLAGTKWPIVPLGKICTFMTGGTPTSTVAEYYDGGTVPWLVSGDIHKFEIWDCEKRITHKAVENSNARVLPKDSVLIALNGQGKTRGTVALLRMENATCNQSLVAITPSKSLKAIPEFIFWVLRSMYSEI